MLVVTRIDKYAPLKISSENMDHKQMTPIFAAQIQPFDIIHSINSVEVRDKKTFQSVCKKSSLLIFKVYRILGVVDSYYCSTWVHKCKKNTSSAIKVRKSMNPTTTSKRKDLDKGNISSVKSIVSGPNTTVEALQTNIKGIEKEKYDNFYKPIASKDSAALKKEVDSFNFNSLIGASVNSEDLKGRVVEKISLRETESH